MAADASLPGSKSKRTPGAAPILDVRGLVKHYPIGSGLRLRRRAGFIQAVDGVDFAIHTGETLGLVGESGCGKTTVARTLMLLEEPSAGEALFHGRNIFRSNTADLKNIRRRIQMIFQDPYASLNPRMGRSGGKRRQDGCAVAARHPHRRDHQARPGRRR